MYGWFMLAWSQLYPEGTKYTLPQEKKWDFLLPRIGVRLLIGDLFWHVWYYTSVLMALSVNYRLVDRAKINVR